MKTISTIVMLFLALISSEVFAQSAEMDKGDKAFENFDFQEALFFYETALDLTPNDPEVTRRIAKTYHRMGQIPIAAQWYQKTLELDASNAEDMLRYAEILKSLGQYDEAVEWYGMFAKLRPQDLRAKSHLADPMYYRDLFADTARYDMKKFKINNENPVLGITLFEDEKFLVSAINLDEVSRNETMQGLPYLDIFLCDLTPENELVAPTRLDKNVNSEFHDGPAFYCFADKTLYITRNNMKGKKPKYNKNGNAILKIYESKYENGVWSPASELKFNDDGSSAGHPSLTKDGQTMYFVSDRDGGFGGADLYVCYKSGNGWSSPVNLGPNVNTEGNEMFPFIGGDGYLYFSSDGHAGLGGMDIFSAEQVGEVWQKPQNLGAPINTTSDDFNIVYDKDADNGFFCTNRSGRGDDDIYFYKHVAIKNMVIAGVIKANAPNVNLSGERIQITKVNSGEVSFQALGELQNFEFTANAGDVVEIVMMDAEFFDPEKPVFTYEVAELISDPFVNVGEQKAELIKMPSHGGELRSMKKDGLADASSSLKRNSDASKNLNSVDKDIQGDAHDTSSLNVGDANLETEKAYATKMAAADKLFAEGKKNEALALYNEALAIKPGDPKATEKVGQINNALIASSDKAYNSKIAAAEKALKAGNRKEALALYREAAALKPGDEKATSQISKIENDLNAETASAYSKKIAEADKLFAQGKWAEAKAAYKASIQSKSDDATYAQNQMAVIDGKLKQEAAAAKQKQYEKKIDQADKLFSQRKWAEAKAAYKAAAEMGQNDPYPNDQIIRINDILNPKKKSGDSEKKPSEFETLPGVVDLVALSIDHVIFEYNKSYIREEDKNTLNAIVKYLKENPETRLLIRAHCDSRGSMAYNQSLSMSRAMAVQGYLMEQGITRDRMKAEWFGEQRPLNGCVDNVPCEEDQYEVNRRAEFKIVAK